MTTLHLASLLRLTPETEKTAFSPSPAVEQAVMAQAQGQAPPPGMDPSQAQAGPGGPPPSAGGPPPGGPGAPPPGDPASGGGAPPPDAGGDGSMNTVIEAVVQKVLAAQQQQQGMGGGAPGAPGAGGAGKGGLSAKIDPTHFHQIMHDMSAMKTTIKAIAESMGIQVPAADLLSMQPPAPMPGQVAGVPQPGAGAPAPGGAPGAGGPPPSNIAQALPGLPPTASKTAAVDATGRIIDRRLQAGIAVAEVGPRPRGTTKKASAVALASMFQKRRR